MKDSKPGSVLVVDDDPLTLKAVSLLLEEQGYTSILCSNAIEALEVSRELIFDVVLTDVKMPEVSGMQLLDNIHSLYPGKPVVLMTGYAEFDSAIKAINKGAFNLLIKPFSPEYMISTVEKAVEFNRFKEREKNYKKELESIVQRRTQELAGALSQTESISREIIQRFTRVAEYRDTDTGNHISRIGFYSNKLADVLNMPEDFIHQITFASVMHDIGKIGIPDNILLKPGKLTFDEFEIMKSHTSIGKNMLDGSSHPVIQMAASIALSHHERWDGTGYPEGLKGNEVPVEGMIVMIADQYDALRSKRPYKKSFSHEEVNKIITEGDGRTMPEHFNPEVLNAFIEIAPLFDDIFNENCSVSELELLTGTGDNGLKPDVEINGRNQLII